MQGYSLWFIPLLTFQLAAAQPDTTATERHGGLLQDDPSNIFTRIEVFNEYQRSPDGLTVNVTTTRGVMAIGKRLTTRIDIPYVSLPNFSSTESTSGIGDISMRLLGYKVIQSKRSALLASVELSLPTAQSPLLGLGKNIVTPVVAYSIYMPKRKGIIAFTYQEYFSFGGDESRKDIRWTRIQIYGIRPWSRHIWTLILPEYYYDHANGGSSMNLEAYCFYRTSNRFAIWLKGGAGIFGEHPARYQWTSELGLRYLIWRKPRNGNR